MIPRFSHPTSAIIFTLAFLHPIPSSQVLSSTTINSMSQYPDSWRKIQQQFAQRGGSNFKGASPKNAIGLGLGAALVGGAFLVGSNALFNGLFSLSLVDQGRGNIKVELGLAGADWSSIS